MFEVGAEPDNQTRLRDKKTTTLVSEAIVTVKDSLGRASQLFERDTGKKKLL